MHSGATMSMLTNLEYLYKQKDKFKLWAIIPKKNGDLSSYLKEMDVTVIQSFYGGNIYKAGFHGIKKIIMIIRCFLKTVLSYISCIKDSIQLKNEGINIVYTNTSTIYYGAWLSNLLNAKHIWHFREFCFEDQNSLRIFDRYFKKMAQKSEKIITISNLMNKYYVEKYYLNNTIMLYNDIAPEYAVIEKKQHIGTNLLITGTLSESKGQLIAIHAMEKMQKLNIKLFIAGAMNSYGRNLLKYVKDNNIQNVTFCGMVKDMKKLRQNIDISIVCSKSEAFGRTIIEDMLSKILVVACNTGSVQELVKDNETGIVYQYNRDDELAKKIIDIIKNNEKYNYITGNAREFADGFIQFNTAKAIEKIMEE